MKLEVRRTKSPQGSGINWRAFFPLLNPVRPPPRILSPHAPPYSRANAEPTVPPVGGRCARWTNCTAGAGIFCSPLRKLFASSWTARLSSVVVDAVELACAGKEASPTRLEQPSLALVGHVVGGGIDGRWCRVPGDRARHPRAGAADPRVRPIFFNHMYPVFTRYGRGHYIGQCYSSHLSML